VSGKAGANPDSLSSKQNTESLPVLGMLGSGSFSIVEIAQSLVYHCIVFTMVEQPQDHQPIASRKVIDQ
jgi:hypothetical protein